MTGHQKKTTVSPSDTSPVAHFHDNIIEGLCSYVTKQEEIYDSDEFNEFSFGTEVFVIQWNMPFTLTLLSGLATNHE